MQMYYRYFQEIIVTLRKKMLLNKKKYFDLIKRRRHGLPQTYAVDSCIYYRYLYIILIYILYLINQQVSFVLIVSKIDYVLL